MVGLYTTVVGALLGCGGSDVGSSDFPDAQSDGPPTSDARGGEDAAEPEDAGGDEGARDAAVDAREAGNDATADTGTDAGADTGSSDARADAADASDAATFDAGDSGAPTGPSLLVSDPGGNRIDLVTTTGTILRTYPAPVANVAGVAFDRRLRDGFFVVGTDSGTTIRKIAWSGAALPSLNTQFAHASLRGLDYWLGATAAQDLLVYVHTNVNNIEVAGGSNVATGADSFSMGFFNNGFQSGFWGVSFLDFDETQNIMLGWYTHLSANAIERWQTASFQTSVPANATSARGLARTASGELWVVDQPAHKVLHLSAAGAVLGSFDTPGTQPAGLSYDPGP